MTGQPSTRERILAAAAETASSQRAFEMTQVAQAAGVSRATLYRHFGDRGALVEAVADRIGRDLEVVTDHREAALDALETVLKRDGLSGVTMERIATEAGIGTATLYRRFDDRDGLLAAFAAERSPRGMVRDLTADPGIPIEEILGPFIASSLAFTKTYGGILQLALSPEARGSRVLARLRKDSESARAALAGYLADEMALGRLRSMDPQLAAEALAGMVIRTGLMSTGDVHEQADELTTLFLRGVSP